MINMHSEVINSVSVTDRMTVLPFFSADRLPFISVSPSCPADAQSLRPVKYKTILFVLL